ncbi:hypothetical protein [Nocardioides sp.]|uniref:hypothetical protein n=1 Tax=Nocardioides sp. TaxID=35761 RepID=UPI0025ED95F4|nr:hypothetical protein [Nocardioides sp.]
MTRSARSTTRRSRSSRSRRRFFDLIVQATRDPAKARELGQSEEAELVTGAIQGSKRLYAITDAGRSALQEQAVALDGVRMRIEVSKRALRGHDRPPEIHEAVGNLRHALHMHSGRWTSEEIERVRNLLNDTAKAIASGPANLVTENTP